MEQITRKAYAKINLVLDVTGRLPNGYHEVSMVMQNVGIHDTLTFTKRGDCSDDQRWTASVRRRQPYL